jgi:hypothetical protein
MENVWVLALWMGLDLIAALDGHEVRQKEP